MASRSFHRARRQWLRLTSLALLVPAPRLWAQSQSKRVEESEQQAQALGYKQDAAKVDKPKFKNFQPGQSCANCNFFKGKAGDALGPCDLFGGREVSARGWCSAWVKKT